MARLLVIILSVLLTLLGLNIGAMAGVKEGMAALDNGDYANAFKEFLPLAKNGDLTAAIQIGLLYHEGKGVKQDYARAMDWYLKAFKGRKGDAFNNIGVMYRDGLGVEKNVDIAYALFWITYWGALGSEETQIRNGRNMNKITAIMQPRQMEDAVKMNVEYVLAFVEKRGKLSEKEQSLKYSSDGHPLKAMAELKESSEPREHHHFTFELRASKNLELDPDTHIDLVTD
jgi:TPR repeat protein